MKILVVEDDRPMLELMVDILEAAHFTTDTATDGDVAFEKAQSQKYDLIILDLKLPKKNGFDIIAQLRTLGNNTPIIVVTSCADLDEKVRGLNLGADDYLTKQFSPQELIARCFANIRRQHRQRRNLIKCRDVMVNFDDMSVYRAGRMISLSKKELGILIELLRNKDKVVSRNHIVEKVWGERDLPVNSNTIDVHIRTLRNKIDRPFEAKKPMIETIRGFGYTVRSDQ